jgi:hypothetical protein
VPSYGYKPSAAAQNVAYGGDNTDNYLAYVPDPMTEDGWAYRMGAAIGPRVGGDPITVYLNLHDPADNPGGIRKTTESGNPTTIVTAAAHTASAKFTLDFNSEVTLNDGTSYPLSSTVYGALHAVGMIESSALPGKDNYLLYRKGDASAPPADPMSPTSSSSEGWLAIWVDYETNVSPEKPDILSPVNAATLSTLTPVFSGNFDDDNETLPNGISADEMESFQIVVRRNDNNSLMWDYDDDSTSAERTARAFTRTYAGSALTAGVVYKWQCRVYDRFGSASPWSDWRTFTVGTGGVSVSAGTPTGKQETRQPTPFTGVWSHSGGLSTNAVRVRIKNRVSGTVVRQIGSSGTGTVAKTVSPGNTISVTWAELVAAATGAGGTWDDLPWGGDYVYEIQARDSSNNWSSWSSPTQAFTVNAAPSVPTNLSPAYSVPPQTSYPLLTATATDVDDTTATGLIVKAGIFGPYNFDNWSFDTDAAGWTNGTSDTGVTATFARATDQFFSSPASGKINVTGFTGAIGAKKYVIHDQYFACVEGQSYQHQGQFRTSNVNIVPHINIDWFNSSFGYISSSGSSEFIPPANTWYYHNIVATAPANAAFMRTIIWIEFKALSAIGSVWFDNLTVEPGLHAVRTMTWDAALGKFKYQTSGTYDIPIIGNYSFWAYSFDGTVYSGGTTVEASATKSATANFVYAIGPTVTVTAPTVSQVFDTDTPTVTWTTSTTQVQRRILVRDAVTLVELIDAGFVVTASQTYEIPEGYLVDNGSYEVLVQVIDNLAAEGSSSWVPFSVDYIEPDPIGEYVGSPYYAHGDVDPSAVLLTWAQASVPSGEFLHYRVNWEPSDDTPYTLEETYQESRRRRIGILPNVNTTSFVDYTPPSHVQGRYRIRQYVKKGSSWVSSQIATVAVQVDFDQAILQTFHTHGTEPAHRVVMEYRGDVSLPSNRDVELWQPMGQRKPLFFKGIANWTGLSGVYRLHGRDEGDVESMLRELHFLDGLPDPLLYRDGRGRRFFCIIDGLVELDKAGGRIREINLTLTEISVPEIYE